MLKDTRQISAGWAFLTGTPAEIRDVAKRYGIYYKKTPRGDVDHTFLTSLVDQSGTTSRAVYGRQVRSGRDAAGSSVVATGAEIILDRKCKNIRSKNPYLTAEARSTRRREN